MRRESSRRLTGPNLFLRGPAAVTEVTCEPSESVDSFVTAWRRSVASLCERFGLDASATAVRVHQSGVSLALSAPIDRLYAAIELNDYAIDVALEVTSPGDAERLDALQRAFAKRNPVLLALEAEAKRRNLPFLWDDDFVSIGHGKHAETWPANALPAVDAVDWQSKRAVPVAFITGTNGKTTTSRMLARIVRVAGYTPGNTSTDGVCINEELVEGGDWTGPGAARTVLRRKEVDFAVLEAARGGILRRGLGVSVADVAIVTNVSVDHLGDWGIHSVAEMARAKAVVGTVVHERGRVVLCADDPNLAALAAAKLFVAPIVWFGGDPKAAMLREHLARGGEAWLLENDELVHYRGASRAVLMRAADIPATYDGAARHNAINALGAAAMASAVGIDDATIVRALCSFGATRKDNPGRADLRTVKGVRVLLDFGHNPQALAATLALTRRLLEQTPGRLFVSTGHAGDRDDSHIRELCETIVSAEPYRIYVRELPALLRGRSLGELPVLFKRLFDDLGYGARVRDGADEAQILRSALSEARPGDVILLTLHLERTSVDDVLKAYEAT